jgi:putative endonuclease
MPGESPLSPRLPWWRRWFGNRSERAAARYLKKLGYRILAKNLRNRLGELDVVALDGACVVFVEVRSTEETDADKPAGSVDLEKQRRLTQLALGYLQRYRLLGKPARFDVLAISWPANQRQPLIRHYQKAFKASGRFQMFS